MHGAQTIYVETSNYHSPADVMYPDQIREVISLAHASSVKVVTWYLPGFKRITLDRRHFATAAAVSDPDLPIDGLGVDIEADIVSNRQRRSDRAAAMGAWVRATYPDLAIAGIVPTERRSLPETATS